MRWATTCLVLLVACGGGDDRRGADGGVVDASVDAATDEDAGATAPCEELPHGWTGEALPEVVVKSEVRLALGPDGDPMVAVVGTTPGETSSREDVLYVAARDDGWSPELVVRDRTAVNGIALAIAPDGTPHVAYSAYNPSSVTRRAELTAEGWVAESLAGDRPTDTSNIAVTPAGDPWILHDGSLYALLLAFRDGDTWSDDVIDDGTVEGGMRSVGLHNALALEAPGRAHITHVAYSTNELFYVVGEPGAWTKHTIDDSVEEERTSIALDASGVVHVAYEDEASVVVASGNDADWTTETVDDADAPGSPRLALSADGTRHLLYVAEDTDELRWAEDSGGEWVVRTLTAARSVYYDLVAGTDGPVHAAWIHPETHQLCYATR